MKDAMVPAEKHPRGLITLFAVEMWERFSFYLMAGILLQYLMDVAKGGMGIEFGAASSIYGSYMALVYFTPFLGGLLAERLLGYRKAIAIGALFMIAGHVALSLAMVLPQKLMFYTGLGLLILGNGAFKPNISTLLGRLYPKGSALRDRGYLIFYMGINIGAFLANFAAAMMRNWFDENPQWGISGWHAAFGLAGIGMFIGMIIFLVNYRFFKKVDFRSTKEEGKEEEELKPLWIQCLAPAAIIGLFLWLFVGPTEAFLGASIPVIIFYLNIWRKLDNKQERNRVTALYVVFGVVIAFWTTFELKGTALTKWTRDHTDRQPNAAMQTFASVFPWSLEAAKPGYFENALPEVPRPRRSMFSPVPEEEYKELEKNKLLAVRDGEPTPVTPRMLEGIYKGTNAETPILPEGKHLRVVNTEIFQSINPGFVILLTLILIPFWGFLERRGREPSTAGKIGMGMLISAGGPIIMLIATLVTHDGLNKSSAWWLFGMYFAVTLGEVFLSPMGLSLISKASPARLQSFMMGGWFLATSFGHKLSGIFGEFYNKIDHNTFWVILIVCNFAFALAIYFLLPWLKRQIGESSE